MKKTYKQTEATIPAMTPKKDIDSGLVKRSSPVSENLRRSCLKVVIALFLVEMMTGVLLMLYYAPAVQTAWGSVWHIQAQVPSGWLIRGLHHYASNVILVAVAFYAALLLFQKAYTGNHAWPWRMAWGLLLMTAALSLSGYLLPWDQWAYWGTQVRANILATTPYVGRTMRDLLLGPDGLGQASLTRFYTLHIVVLPCLFVLMLVGIVTSRRWNGRGQGRSMEASRDVSCCYGLVVGDVLLVAVFVAGVLAWTCYTHEVLGCTLLDAPADPTSSDYPARPEWYALFLYQWLKYFETPNAQIVGAIVVPTIAFVGIMLAPNFVKNTSHSVRHIIVVSTLAIGFSAAVALTVVAMQADRQPPDHAIDDVKRRDGEKQSLAASDKSILSAATYHEQRRWADWVAKRSFELANQHGIPVEGPLVMLARDPQIQGPKLFAAHCATCHRYDGHDGRGRVYDESATSSDLADFGSFERIRGFLREPMNPLYFGRMKKPDGEPAHTKMQRWLEERQEECESESQRNAFESELDDVAIFLASEAASLGDMATMNPSKNAPGRIPPVDEKEAIERGRRVFMSTCNECHTYQGQQSGTSKAPEMYAYASWRWIFDMISDPSHDSLYRARGREPAQMPSFQDTLSESDRRAIAVWLSGRRGP